MRAMGLIFSNIHDSSLSEMTRRRSIASVPFGGRYRLIDFPLSEMVNADISNIGIVTHCNYRSLVNHIRTGKDWDLARRVGGIQILSPFITAGGHADSRLYSTRLEALLGVIDFISSSSEKYIVLADGDSVHNIDLSQILAYHESKHSDITVVVKNHSSQYAPTSSGSHLASYSSNGLLTEVTEYYHGGNANGSVLNINIINRVLLLDLLYDAAARGYTDFYSDIIGRSIGKSLIYVYEYTGFFEMISSLGKYFDTSMKLLDKSVRSELFDSLNRPVYTKVQSSPSVRYLNGASVSDSLIADGCIIAGKVENSLLFRGVFVGEGATVKNSVLMQNTYVGADSSLSCIISDKDVIIRDARTLCGDASFPFYISKGRMV